jgi:hypothetical protein
VDAEESKRIGRVLGRTLPHLRPKAKALIEEEGFASKRIKLGLPMLRVADGWCVFFNEGCVLHKIGAEDGDSYQYKPSQCALFPLERNDDGDWYVRQWDYEGEQWDLFCLNPKATKVPAAKSLAVEIELAAKVDAKK